MRSRNQVFPRLAAAYLTRNASANIEHRPEDRVFGVVCGAYKTHFYDTLFRHFSPRKPRTNRMALLGSHIFDVVSLRPLEKMFGVTTNWVITRMKYMQNARIFAVMQKVRHSASAKVKSMAVYPNTKVAVAIMLQGGGPRPTLIGTANVHMTPEISDVLAVNKRGKGRKLFLGHLTLPMVTCSGPRACELRSGPFSILPQPEVCCA